MIRALRNQKYITESEAYRQERIYYTIRIRKVGDLRLEGEEFKRVCVEA